MDNTNQQHSAKAKREAVEHEENNRPNSLNVVDNSPKKRNDNKNKSKNKKKNESAKRKNGNRKQQQDAKDKSEKLTQEESPISPTKSIEQINLPTSTSNQEPDNDSQQPEESQVVVEINSPIKETPQTTADANIPKNSKRKHSDLKTKELKEQLFNQDSHIKSLTEQLKLQRNKTKELETALVGTTRTCNQLEKLLQQELSLRVRLEGEIESLEQTVSRLKTQIATHEKNKFNTDELMRVLNATLMERETEVSILKLKLTRYQTNPSSIVGINAASSISSMKQQDPCQTFASTGRSNSEFDRSSYARSTMRAEMTASARGSTSQLRSGDKDASVWATVPEELTPSKRPSVLEKSFQSSVDSAYNPYGNIHSLINSNHISTPIGRDRRYKTLPRSMKSPSQEFKEAQDDTSTTKKPDSSCQVTNLDESNSTNQSGSGNKTDNITPPTTETKPEAPNNEKSYATKADDAEVETNNVASTSLMSKSNDKIAPSNMTTLLIDEPSSSTQLQNKTPVKKPSGLRKIFDKFRRSDSSASNSRSKTDLDSDTPLATPEPSPFKRNAVRSTMVGAPKDIRAQMSPLRHPASFQPNKPFAQWDTDMLVDWLNIIGLSMYATQCRRWVRCGAHIMNATPAEVDKGLGITNHLHRKKLRLAISELNGDCDKITKAAAKLDYLWVARWLDDMGLPQYKEAFINARVDGRVLNYLTVEDLVSMGVKSLLHHASIRCGIKVLRSIKFDLQLLKRRATSDEVEQMNIIRQQMNQISDQATNISETKTMSDETNTEVALWTCHRVMEWLRMIDFAEFAPNLRGSGVHGGLIMFEDGFNIDTMCSLLSIPISRTLLRRHLATFFEKLIGDELLQRKRQYQDMSSNAQLNPLAEIKSPKKSQWFSKLKTSKVGQDVSTDEYLCPMYPVEPQLIKNKESRRAEQPRSAENGHHLARIPESINV